MKKLFFTLIVLLMPALVFAQDAPLGLKWGMTPDEVVAAGSNVLEKETKGRILLVKMNKVPKPISIAEHYGLFFDKEMGLQKISLVGKDITSDAYGFDGKKQYNTFKSALTEKYGKPSDVFEYSERALYDESDEFYQCLAYDGCGTWISFFKNENGSALIELNGLRRGEGYLRFSFESKNWSNCIDKNREEQRNADADAL